MTINAEIFSQGEELVSGQTVDTNAAWLSEQLVRMGFTVTRHTTVGDRFDDLIGLLKEISIRADCCICTGGLGPTVDDLTAEAVARAFVRPLQFDPIAYEQIREFFIRRDRSMPESNRKQALFPQDALRLDNAWGTAPGFALQQQRCWFAFVPGVPYEMKHLFREKITPLLNEKFTARAGVRITIKTVGIGESDLQERLDGLTFPEAVQLSFRTGNDDNQTKLLFAPDFPEAEIKAFTGKVTKLIGSSVFAVDWSTAKPRDLVAVISELFHNSQQTLAVLETLSQGLIAAKCMGQTWLLESCYMQMVAAACRKTEVTLQQDLLKTATDIAAAYKTSSGADNTLVQLCAAEDDIIADKNQRVILYQALVTAKQTYTWKCRVGGTAKRKQNQAALRGLDFLRRSLTVT